ncbi:MAG: hypothetical protein QM783_06535 [Phycisphaerales bacterium]
MNKHATTAGMLWLDAQRGLTARHVITCAGLAAAVIAAVTAGGCSSSGSGLPKDAKPISADAFRGPATTAATPTEKAAAAPASASTMAAEPPANRTALASPPSPPSPPAPSSATAAKPPAAKPGTDNGGVVISSEPGRRVVAVVDKPPQANQSAPAAGRDVLADCMVGQINGRPVFSSEILDPLDGKFRNAAKGVTMGPAAGIWVRDAAEAIRAAVQLRVRDELLLGEARARLTPEARQGLLYFLQRIDQWASGQQGGSQVAAEDEIRRRTGEDYEKFLESQRDQTLIRELIKENVTPAVRVPWRKVERFYNENQDVINPPPRASVRFVQVDAANAASVARVEQAVGNQAAFKEVAESEINLSDRKEGGLVVRDLDKPYGEIEWVGAGAWNRLAATLEPGKWGGPITVGPHKIWAYREQDVVMSPRSLEDAQLQISTGLLAVKENQEQSEFFGQLLGKGSFTPISKMTMELLVLAAQRHLPPEVASKIRDANQPTGIDAPALERSPVIPTFDEPVKPAKPAEPVKPEAPKPAESTPPATGGSPAAPSGTPK